MYQLILASESPRRRQLLTEAGFSFTVVPVKVSEIPNENLNVNDQILDIAGRKADASYAALKSSLKDDFIVITADTEVIYDGKTLGKPSDRQDAYRMIRLLSGKTHETKTGVVMIESSTHKKLSQIETTRVTFRSLTDDEIWTYVDSGEPMDKAGSYGIQGLGRGLVEKIEGPLDNVVGLPMTLVKKMLHEIQTFTLEEIQKKVTPAKILAVSKLQTADKIRKLYIHGQRDFGENYVQEALEKQELLEDMPDIRWHLIGHLQKNKAKHVVGKFELIHSVDSVELAQALSRHCAAKKIEQKILLQVNVAEEYSKEGFPIETLKTVWPELVKIPHLKIFGLMTMPPLTENREEVRPYFRELKKLMLELQTQTDLSVHPLSELSMGTSHDYPVAVEEGASIVRLGTILFGERTSKR
jgi:MAF protein